MFINEFYTNLKIINQDLYKAKSSASGSVRAQPVLGFGVSAKPGPSVLMKQDSITGDNNDSSQAPKRGPPKMLQRGGSKQNLKSISDFNQNNQRSQADLLSFGKSLASSGNELYFTAQHLQDRVRQYAQEAGIPIEYIERYSQESLKPTTSERQHSTVVRVLEEENEN